jgi:hypothetical protein
MTTIRWWCWSFAHDVLGSLACLVEQAAWRVERARLRTVRGMSDTIDWGAGFEPAGLDDET